MTGIKIKFFREDMKWTTTKDLNACLSSLESKVGEFTKRVNTHHVKMAEHNGYITVMVMYT